VRAQDRRLVYELDGGRVDLARRELRARGVPVPIGGRAFEIIEVSGSVGQVSLSPRVTFARVWPGAIVEDNTLQFHISRDSQEVRPGSRNAKDGVRAWLSPTRAWTSGKRIHHRRLD